MKTVYKYVLPITDVASIKMHKDAEIVHVDNQLEQLCIWAVVDNELPIVLRKFRIAGTGHRLDYDHLKVEVKCHLGTVKLYGGALILHVFEIK